MSKPLKTFISYARENRTAKNKLITYLKGMEREELIKIWADNEIIAGDKWREEIFSTNLPNSDLLLYLVSASSLASENCNRELGIALKENIRPILIILEDCDWKNYKVSNVHAVSAEGFHLGEWESQKLGDIQALPDEGKPLNEWNPRSRGWTSVAVGLRETIETMLSQAELALQQGNFLMTLRQIDKAIERYSHAIKLNPNYAEAYNNRGMAYDNVGDIDGAIGDFNTAIQLNPNDAETYYNRGAVHVRKGDFANAIADFTKVIQLESNNVKAYCSRGLCRRAKGEVDRAIADFTKAIDLKPNYTDAYYNRGLAYDDKDQADRAIADYTKAIDLNPNYTTNAYKNRGAAYVDKGDFDRAIIDYTKAIDLSPAFVNAYCNRGGAWLHMGEWDKARTDLTTARNMGVDIIASFHNDYKNVEAYERANRVKLPEDIAAMLTQRRRSRYPKKQKLLSADGTPLESPDVLNLLAKLRDAGPPLSQYVQARPTFGIRTGASGAFVVDSATRDRLIADHPASADILKPFLHGRDIRRWEVEKPDIWLIFAHRRIEVDRYPAIRKHLEKYRSALSKRAGKQKWYELPTTKSNAELFTQTKLICPNNYDHQTFAVDTDGFYCGDTCYLIPTEETWLCGLLNSRVVEWFYSQTSNQLTGDYLRARSRYMQQIPIPDLTPTQKSLIGKIVDYLIYLRGQPTTSGGDLAHSRDFIMLKYFERIIDGLVYESYLPEALHQGDKQFFKPLFDERLPQLEEIQGDKMAALREIFERLYERTHPVRRNLFFLNSVKPIRIIEGKA